MLTFLEDGGADLEMARPGWPRIDAKTLATSAPGVFVAGDLAHGTRLLIDAVASGKAAARSIYTFLTGRPLDAEYLELHLVEDGYRRERGYESIRRVPVPLAPPADRLSHPDAMVEVGYDEPLARREASRCLDCGITPVFDGSRCVLCGGCVDVCPTLCLKIVTLDRVADTPDLQAAVGRLLGDGVDLAAHSAILKDEDRCIRCAACVMRCPADAIKMDRVACSTTWRTA
jgi:ferredoxin